MANFDLTVDARKLADLDEARDYDAASSYNFLNAELRRLREAMAAGGIVTIESESGRLSLHTIEDMSAWAKARYPHADCA